MGVVVLWSVTALDPGDLSPEDVVLQLCETSVNACSVADVGSFADPDEVLLVNASEQRFVDDELPDDVPSVDADGVDVRLWSFPLVCAVEIVERVRRVDLTVLVRVGRVGAEDVPVEGREPRLVGGARDEGFRLGTKPNTFESG